MRPVSHEDFDREDELYDEARQRLVDAYTKGEQAGEQGKDAAECPFFTFEPEFNEWQHGRTAAIDKRRKAA